MAETGSMTGRVAVVIPDITRPMPADRLDVALGRNLDSLLLQSD